MLDKTTILESLKNFIVPYLDCDVVAAKAVQTIAIESHKIKISLKFGFPCDFIKEQIAKGIQQILASMTQLPLEIEVSWEVLPRVVQGGLASVPQIKNIIAIASGKGGVGKSTTAANIALALAQTGARVGVLDADIYGPNQPHMLGAKGGPEIKKDKKLAPVNCYGIQTMSIGYLVDARTPMIWRGPMVTAALQQLLNDTLWDRLDYLIVDMPPGTGDIQLTLAQRVPVSGAVIVTTPQDVALLDALKGLEMFKKVKVRLLGVIENMSVHVCNHCGHEESLFGEGGGEQLAKSCQVPFLGKIPLAKEIREAIDKGEPTMALPKNNPFSNHYREIALKVAAQLSLQPVNHALKFPKIVVENG